MKLSTEEIARQLTTLPEWTQVDGKLHREYKFPDFGMAIGFLAASAPSIEKMDHHPEWCNVYSRVTVNLVTHDDGGITEKDFALARVLEAIARKMQ